MRRPLAGLLLLLLSSSALVAPPTAADQAPGAWTVLIYLDAEGNLEPSAIDNMLEMEAVGSGRARVLVQLDRGPEYDERDGDWQGTRRYEVPREAVPSGARTTLASTLVEDMGEVNMADPQSLATFLAWGVARAPADHYLVILWDHGGAWTGLLGDHTPVDDSMSLPELRAGLEMGRQRAGLAAWDLVLLDACLMGTIEVAHAIGSTARVVVASEEVVPGLGSSYRAIVEAAKEAPAVRAEELAGRLVRAFASRYQGDAGVGPDGHLCLGACGSRPFDATYAAYTDDAAVLAWYDMSREPALWAAWEEFNAQVAARASREWPALIRAARSAERFLMDDPQAPSAMDVADFARRVESTSGDAALRDAARALDAAVVAFVGGHSVAPGHRNATGLMAKFPLPAAVAVEAEEPDVYATEADFAGADAGYRALALAAEAGDVAEPGFGDIEVEGLDNGLSLVTVTVLEENPDTVEIAVTDESADLPVVLAWVDADELEPFEGGLIARFAWDGRVFVLTGGVEDERVIAPAFREGEGYLLDGEYREEPDAEPQAGFLRFDMDGKFLSAWVVDDLASEVQPGPDAVFAPSYLGWDADGEPLDIVEERVRADADGAWALDKATLFGALTGFSAYAVDLAGNAAFSEAIVLDLPEPTDEEEPPAPTPSPPPSAPARERAEDDADDDVPGPSAAFVAAAVLGAAMLARGRARSRR